ncbi:hypothetical protein MOA67_gp287 [Klebsiella phage KpLz-2_45]|uniref:hypothetical protein n=1 Tax=Klebsiella phage KpLz-2_45 TaxID=2698923 RepID=UPI001F132DCF|nr:hypothetical protein MOA67_gp287 [Klebsiella phage KpLz-2_45]UKS72136.1 hypothetical protein KpLz245_2700 [Klebsiella phage KpLz-2_45]
MRFSKMNSVVFLENDIESNDVRSIELIFSHDDANALGDRLLLPGDSYNTVVLVRKADHSVYEAALKILQTYDDYIFTLTNHYVEPASIVCFTIDAGVFKRLVKNIS